MTENARPYLTRGGGKPDYTTRTVEGHLRYDRVLDKVVMVQGYALIPIFINEPIRDQRTYYSSSLGKLEPLVETLNALVRGPDNALGAEASVQGALGSILSGVSGALSAVTSGGGVGVGPFNYIDFRSSNSLTIYCINSLDVAVQVRVEGCYDAGFEHVFPLDQDNNPFNVDARVSATEARTRYETLIGDYMSFVRTRAIAQGTPTVGSFSLIAGLRR